MRNCTNWHSCSCVVWYEGSECNFPRGEHGRCSRLVCRLGRHEAFQLEYLPRLSPDIHHRTSHRRSLRPLLLTDSRPVYRIIVAIGYRNTRPSDTLLRIAVFRLPVRARSIYDVRTYLKIDLAF